MRQLYTLEYIQKCKSGLKRESKIVGITIVALFCIALLFICFRNPSNHTPPIIAVSLIWTLGIWFLMIQIFVKVMPLKRDISFCKRMMDGGKKEYDGIVADCEEEITMHRMPCYILKIEVEDKGEIGIRQVYLDKRFLPQQPESGSKVRVLVVQHFVFALDNGGTKDE